MPGPRGLLDMTGEPPGGMFAQQAAPPAINLTDMGNIHLPQGMYYGYDPGWMSGGGPSTGEPDRPAGRAAFYAPGQPTEEFIAANMAPPPAGFNPLAYTQETWDPEAAANASPGFFRDRNGGIYTDNYRLLGLSGPGSVMRNRMLIDAVGRTAKRGLPWGADTSFSDTAESGTAGERYVSPGNALSGRNKWDAYYWPGGAPWGYTRWPYQTDV